jgi:DNA-binding NtrC family response regulator
MLDNAEAGAHSTSPYALIVDDDPLVLMATCDIIEEAGFRFYEAASGDEAKALLEANGGEITLLFTDVEMPGETDGFALARFTAEHWPNVAIVVASGRVSPTPGNMPDNATFIGKPFSAQIVIDHLRSTLPDGKQPAPLRAAG